jgi:excisionase family DNA binding protein
METRNDGKKPDLIQAALFLGVSPHTLRAWTRERRIAFHRCGRRIVFAVSDLERFLADNRVEARER